MSRGGYIDSVKLRGKPRGAKTANRLLQSAHLLSGKYYAVSIGLWKVYLEKGPGSGKD